MSTDAIDPRPGYLYVQSNEPDHNRLLTFERAADGSLTPAGTYETGGAGDGVAHLTSQGSVTLTGDGRFVLVTNAGSGNVSVFAVGEDRLTLTRKAATGRAPKSVAEHDGLVYVLNTGDPSLTGFRLGLPWHEIEPIAGSTRYLSAGADPAQVGFSPDGTILVVTERGANAIVAYPVDEDGYLGRAVVQPSSGPTPYGFAFTRSGGLVVTEAFGAQVGMAAASSYVLADGGVAPVSRSVGNGRSEICWAVVSKDDRYAYTTNYADGAVSRYAINADGSLELDEAAAGVAVEGHPGLRDEDLSRDGRYLYAIDADSRRLFGWAVGERGSLAPIGSWERLPATVAGLAVS
ncbi:lactonase family protein [Pengzhenrongella sp.]|jgi:6-phosphogluconolactonase (cycloisomerase 2 family)|uniref:lactonase family protein n=1 Tax=Pengzhenrongella sp. TaxID=2888820 RepID=UPI002F949846